MSIYGLKTDVVANEEDLDSSNGAIEFQKEDVDIKEENIASAKISIESFEADIFTKEGNLYSAKMPIGGIEFNVALKEEDITYENDTIKVIDVVIATNGEELASSKKYIEDINYGLEKLKLVEEQPASTKTSIEQVQSNVVGIKPHCNDLKSKCGGLEMNVADLNEENATAEKKPRYPLSLLAESRKSNQLEDKDEVSQGEVSWLTDMISEKEKNITVLPGDIECLPTEVAENCGEFLTAKKHIVDLEYQVAELTVMHDEINPNPEEQVANNMYLSENNSDVSRDLDSAKTGLRL